MAQEERYEKEARVSQTYQVCKALYFCKKGKVKGGFDVLTLDVWMFCNFL